MAAFLALMDVFFDIPAPRMKLSELDRLDRQILLLLDADATASLSQIARKLRLGSDLVEYRMRRFQTEGVIRRLTPTINPAALGLQVFKTYLKHRVPERLKKSWVRRLNQHPKTYWLCEGYGRWDLLVSVAARSLAEYQETMDAHLADTGEYILDLGVFPLVEVERYPKDYLLPAAQKKGGKPVGWSSRAAALALDELERRLLCELSDNCRRSDTELAGALGVTPGIVSYRKKKLLENGVIVGHRVQLDYEVLEMSLIKVFLELKDYSPGSRERIRKFCCDEPAITCFSQQLGRYSLELEAEMPSYHELSRLLDRFREEFSNEISRTEYMTLTKDYYHRVPRSPNLAK